MPHGWSTTALSGGIRCALMKGNGSGCYRIFFSSKNMGGLDRPAKQRIKKAIEGLAEQPPRGCRSIIPRKCAGEKAVKKQELKTSAFSQPLFSVLHSAVCTSTGHMSCIRGNLSGSHGRQECHEGFPLYRGQLID